MAFGRNEDKMNYKGFKIVQQYVRYEVWDLDKEGNADYAITDYESEADGYQVWDKTNDWQSEDLNGTYDSLDEVKQAIDEHIEQVAFEAKTR